MGDGSFLDINELRVHFREDHVAQFFKVEFAVDCGKRIDTRHYRVGLRVGVTVGTVHHALA